MGRWGSGLVIAIVAFCVPAAARADGTPAVPCDDDPFHCVTAPIAFSGENVFPIELDFDSGWIPQGSDLQVHLWGALWANTRVSLAGRLDASWPEALQLAAPGDVDGGLLAYHYGVDVGAEGKVDISVLGQTYTWQGDLPYVPQVDVELEGDEAFDAWAFDPGVTVPSSANPQKVAQIGVGDLIGASIPGIDGGFELDVGFDLDVTYMTERIVITTSSGEPVAGGPILDEGQTTFSAYDGGPHADLDVYPEGRVDYVATVHLIPAFYVELLGNTWTLPIVDVPIDVPIASVPWIFEPQRVHAPLPDVRVPETIDFGRVVVGEKRIEGFTVDNAGEAPLEASLVSSAPEAFGIDDEVLIVDALGKGGTAATFHPKEPGVFEAMLHVATNDPDAPLVSIALVGEGVEAPAEPELPAIAAPESPETESGCACSAAGSSDPEWASLAAASLLGLVLPARRRWTRARP